MRAFLLVLCIVMTSLNGKASAASEAPMTYADAYAQAIASDKPLVVLVGSAKAILDFATIQVSVDELPEFKSGDIVVSAPDAGKLYWVATYTDPAAVSIPKKVAYGCSSGKCSFTYFPEASCQGASCSETCSCNAGGQCSSCTTCTAGQCQQCQQQRSGFRLFRR